MKVKIEKDAMDKKWKLLETQATKEPALNEDDELSEDVPSWLDPSKLRQCQAVCLKHFAR